MEGLPNCLSCPLVELATAVVMLSWSEGASSIYGYYGVGLTCMLWKTEVPMLATA
jgi:hypothetical protein